MQAKILYCRITFNRNVQHLNAIDITPLTKKPSNTMPAISFQFFLRLPEKKLLNSLPNINPRLIVINRKGINAHRVNFTKSPRNKLSNEFTTPAEYWWLVFTVIVITITGIKIISKAFMLEIPCVSSTNGIGIRESLRSIIPIYMSPSKKYSTTSLSVNQLRFSKSCFEIPLCLIQQ